MRALIAKVATIKGELAWVIVGQLLSAIAALASVRIMTGLLSPVVYGQLALGMTIALLINLTLFGPLVNGIVRFYAPAAESHQIRSYLTSTRELSLWATLFVAIGALGLAVVMFACNVSKWIPLATSTLLFSVLTGYNNILSGIQNAARQRVIVALHQGFESWARFAFAAVLVLWIGRSSTLAVLGFSLGIVLVLTSQYVFFQPLLQQSPNPCARKNWRGEILRYSWPFCTWSIFSWAQFSSDRWALATFTGANEVGLYAVLYQVGTYPVTMASAMVMQLLAPILYQSAGDGNDQIRNAHATLLGWRVTKLALALTIIACIAGAMLHRQIFQVLVAPRYASVSSLLPLTLLASGIVSASQIIELSLMSRMKTRLLIAAKIITALIGVSLNFAGARLYGMVGVVTAGVIIAIFYLLWMIFLERYAARTHATRSSD